MPVRPVAALALIIAVAACGGSTPTSAPGSGAAGPAATSAGATGSAATAAPINLNGVDVCALVPIATIEALTGATGFKADGRSGACFWGIRVPGAEQYVEVSIGRAPATLGDYTINVNGTACPAAPIPGIGTEARGGVCALTQTKVWLIAIDKGVSVQVIVNEPKGALTPEKLADVVKAVVAGLG